MSNRIHITALSTGETLFERDAEYLRLPLEDGRIGVLANHAPMLCALGEGELYCRDDRGEGFSFHIDGGVARVESNSVRLLIPTEEK